MSEKSPIESAREMLVAGIHGVESVSTGHYHVQVLKAPMFDWAELTPGIEAALRDFLARPQGQGET